MKPIFRMLLFFVLFAGVMADIQGEETKRILYINSYHQGYGSSDDVHKGILKVLTDKPVSLKTLFMDTKRKSDPDSIKKVVQNTLKSIQTFKPDVIIASDDNAVKYIIEPHFKNGPVPVVFCGVNWSAEPYGLPTDTVTGMLEVLPIEATVELIRKAKPDLKTITILSEDTTSEQKNVEVLNPLFRSLKLKPTYKLVSNFEEWKREFKQANSDSDLIFIPTNGAVKHWDDDRAESFIEREIKKPVFTCDDFMMPYAVIGMTKIASEQGEWAAKQAVLIAQGTKTPAQITLTKNKQTKGYINTKLAKVIGFNLPKQAMTKLTPIE